MDFSKFGTINMEYIKQMFSTPADDDGPIYMVNFMRYRATAEYSGDAGPAEAISGEEADDRYAPTDVLAKIGADVAYFGPVVDGDGTWHRMGIVRYPTRISFLEMQNRPDFQEKAVHKEAGMEFTIVFGALPTGPVLGTPDGSGQVRFTAYPEGVAPPQVTEGAVLAVEGTAIGDERRWGHLHVSWAERSEDVPDGAMSVTTSPRIDRLANLIADSFAH